MSTAEARRELLAVVKEMEALGLVAGASGNASLRLDADHILVTPTSLPYRAMAAEDLVAIDLEGRVVEGRHRPSSELPTHLAVYRARPDAGAVLHTHSTYANVCAVAGLAVPPIIDELVVRVGGEVAVAEYGFPGTKELGDAAVAALEGRKAVLLRNHGLVALGKDAWEALDICQLVERVAQVFIHTRLLGRAHELPPDVVRREMEMFRDAQAGDGTDAPKP